MPGVSTGTAARAAARRKSAGAGRPFVAARTTAVLFAAARTDPAPTRWKTLPPSVRRTNQTIRTLSRNQPLACFRRVLGESSPGGARSPAGKGCHLEAEEQGFPIELELELELGGSRASEFDWEPRNG